MIVFWILWTAGAAVALYENCDYYQELQPDQPYYIYNPGYPASYRPGKNIQFNDW